MIGAKRRKKPCNQPTNQNQKRIWDFEMYVFLIDRLGIFLMRVIKALLIIIFIQKKFAVSQPEILRRARSLADNFKTLSIKTGKWSPGPCLPWQKLVYSGADLLCVVGSHC